MYLNICKVDNKVIDFKISESKKENSDFNKSLVTAGFSFWKDCNIDILHVNNMQDAKKILLSYPLNKKRVFESIEESMEETKIICYWQKDTNREIKGIQVCRRLSINSRHD